MVPLRKLTDFFFPLVQTLTMKTHNMLLDIYSLGHQSLRQDCKGARSRKLKADIILSDAIKKKKSKNPNSFLIYSGTINSACHNHNSMVTA